MVHLKNNYVIKLVIKICYSLTLPNFKRKRFECLLDIVHLQLVK